MMWAKGARDYGENTFIMYAHPNLCIERNTQILNFESEIEQKHKWKTEEVEERMKERINLLMCPKQKWQ